MAMKDDLAELHPEWAEFLDILGDGPERLRLSQFAPTDSQVRLESYKYLLIGLCQGINMTMFPDPDFPVWMPNAHFPLGYLAPNPDAVYRYTQVNPDGIYRLWGIRNSVHLANLQIGTEWFGASFLPDRPLEENENQGRNSIPLASYDFDEGLTLDQDGSFEVMLSRSRPDGWQGDWWQLPPKSHNLLLRYFAYDLETEIDPVVRIERLDGPARPSRVSGYRYGHGIKAAAHKATEILAFFANVMAEQRRLLGINTLKLTTYEGAGFTNQAYLQALYSVDDDEALILETEIPKTCRYWNFQLADELFAVFDYVNIQNSVNGFAAHLDADGKFRAVVSAQDPGVLNWLDTGGHPNGVLLGRWTRADSYPLPTLRRVKLADLASILPPETKWVSSDERRTMLKRRRDAHLKRLGI